MTQQPPNQETAIAKRVGSEQALAQLLSKEMRAFQSLLPRHITPERLARLALEAASRNKDILECTSDSIVKALIDCATMGLEPVGKGGVHLVPFKNKHNDNRLELTAITDYRGEITLAYRAGFVKSVRAQAVHQGDAFKYVAGDDERIEHTPAADVDRFNPKTLVYVYAIVELTTGGKVRKVLNLKGIKRYQEKSRAKSGPWKEESDFVAMALKTVIRRAMNEVPQSAEYRELVRDEQVREYGEDAVIIDADFEAVPGAPAKDVLNEARGSK